MKKSLIFLIVVLAIGTASAILFWPNSLRTKGHNLHFRGFKEIGSHYSKENRFAFICVPKAALYRDSSGSKPDSFLYPGDSLQFLYYGNTLNTDGETAVLYPVAINTPSGERMAYIRGKSIGEGKKFDVDHDGKDELAAAHYTNYKCNRENEEADGDAEVVIIKDKKIIAKAPFKAHGAIYFTPLDSNRSFPGFTFLKVWDGVEACDFENTERVMVYDGKHIYFIFENIQLSSAGVFGNYYDYIFPLNRGGHKDSILSIWNQVEFKEDETEPYIHDRDTSVYCLKSGIFKKVRDYKSNE